jgi:hypothetical protein
MGSNWRSDKADIEETTSRDRTAFLRLELEVGRLRSIQLSAPSDLIHFGGKLRS